jgi:hypothetical protein
VLFLCATAGKKKATASTSTYNSSDMAEAEFDTISTAAGSTAFGGSKKRKATTSRSSSPVRSDNGKHNCFCSAYSVTQCFVGTTHAL